jgi:hypothetical protein
MDSSTSPSVAIEWLERIRKKTIKNISHTEFITKYAGYTQNIDKLVLILCGLRYSQKEYFIIKIHGAIYEPFAGPHLVQIGNDSPFWVHSLTAFRREFFGLTDKLSFERSVFVGLSDGEVVRLKIARPYLYMQHDVAIANGDRLRIMKNVNDSFYITNKDVNKHKEEMKAKKDEAVATEQAVRSRVRNHLVNSVQHLFCSYMRDHHITPEIAERWFYADMGHALDQCKFIYSRMNRVRSLDGAIVDDYTATSTVATADACSAAMDIMHSSSSVIDTSAVPIPRNASDVSTQPIIGVDGELGSGSGSVDASSLLLDGHMQDIIADQSLEWSLL